jgi:signal transduction histidine kinase
MAGHLVSIGQSVNKISRINQALSLISKIENDQYPELSVVNLNRKIEGILSQLHDFIVSRKLNVQFEATEEVEIKMNPDLSEFLFSNLIGNAIKHNIDKGWITINLSSKELILRNSGKDPGVDTNQLFFRFKKAEHSTDSPGLGLAIVKKVTDLYGMTISYEFSEDVHSFHIIFG